MEFISTSIASIITAFALALKLSFTFGFNLN
jgi:hypothetical protein